MPFKSNDALDDEILLDGTNGFTTGQVSATRPDNIANTSFAEGLNLDYDDFGNLITRSGCVIFQNVDSIILIWNQINANWENVTSYYGSNLNVNAEVIAGYYFDTSASEVIVIGATIGTSSQLYYATSSGSFLAIAGSSFSNSAEYLYFAQLNDKLYYSDSFSSLKYINATNVNSAITAGKISRIDVINQGSNLSTIPAVTIGAPPAGGVQATAEAVVANDGNLVAINITNPGSGYTTAPSVNIGGGGGAHAVAYVSLAPPSQPIYLTMHTQRLFCASADTTKYPDTLYFSDILDGESWDPAGSVRVGGDGDPITGLYSWFANKLLVFKERSIWAVDADPLVQPADWVISLISGNIGCVSHRSIAAVGADVLFLAYDGVRSLAQIQAGTQTDVGLPLSAPINDLISKINKSNLAQCDAVYWNNRYMLSVPKTESAIQSSEFNIQTENFNDLILENGNYLVTDISINNTLFVYHLLAKAWLGEWNNWTVRDFVPTAFSNMGPMLMFCGSINNISRASGQVYIFNDYAPQDRFAPRSSVSYLDAGQPYQSSLTTKAFNFNEPLVDKIGYNIQFSTENPYSDWEPELDFKYSTNMSETFSVLDNKVSIPAQTFKYQKAYNLISKGRWNSIQFKQECEQGRMVVQSVIATAFPQTIKVQQ